MVGGEDDVDIVDVIYDAPRRWKVQMHNRFRVVPVLGISSDRHHSEAKADGMVRVDDKRNKRQTAQLELAPGSMATNNAAAHTSVRCPCGIDLCDGLAFYEERWSPSALRLSPSVPPIPPPKHPPSRPSQPHRFRRHQL